jgi:hypothetical protein
MPGEIHTRYLPQTKDSIMKQPSKKSHASLPPSARGMTTCSHLSLSACSTSVGSKTDNSIAEDVSASGSDDCRKATSVDDIVRKGMSKVSRMYSVDMAMKFRSIFEFLEELFISYRKLTIG